ncbi:MAG: hypothetical protein E7650_04595 [Ruminococcaceae bacterium]|nr:hypothetical protein [Oscillospiraceae bacterium]MBQ2757515.1 hypothetical protein [Clostridia bacterium]
MELYKEILCHLIQHETVEIRFPDLTPSHEAVEAICYRTLKKIKEILQDNTLEDRECFEKIEEIICAFEEIGSSGGERHDFG